RLRLHGTHLLTHLQVHQSLRVHLREDRQDLADVAVLHGVRGGGGHSAALQERGGGGQDGDRLAYEDVGLAVVGGDDVRCGQHLHARDAIERVDEDVEVVPVGDDREDAAAGRARDGGRSGELLQAGEERRSLIRGVATVGEDGGVLIARRDRATERALREGVCD